MRLLRSILGDLVPAPLNLHSAKVNQLYPGSRVIGIVPSMFGKLIFVFYKTITYPLRRNAFQLISDVTSWTSRRISNVCAVMENSKRGISCCMKTKSIYLSKRVTGYAKSELCLAPGSPAITFSLLYWPYIFRCNFLNFAKNTRCLQCHEKPTNRLLNPGEWECVSWVPISTMLLYLLIHWIVLVPTASMSL